MTANRRNLRHCWIVLKKELMDGLRDRAAVIGLALQTIPTPIIWAAIMLIAANRMNSSDIVLPVAGGDNAPALVDWLDTQIGVEIVPAPADPAQSVRDGTYRVALVIPAEFRERMANGFAAPVEIVTDSGAGASSRAAERVQALVAGYGAEVASLRLMARGVAPDIGAPLRVDTRDVSPPGRKEGGLSVLLPMLLLWTALFGGVGIAADSTLGERERGSLEPLLLNPVSRTAVIAGKWLASASLACASVVLAGVTTLIVVRSIPWHEYGLQLSSSDRDLLVVTFSMLPAALFWSALVTLVSASSRSQQQAQTRFGLLFMTVAFTTLASFLFPFASVPWLSAVPILSQINLSVDVLGGAHPAIYRYIVAAAGSVILALVLVAATARLLRRETIVFRT
ncbi:MAG TPA: ABC transporter permease [Terriglobia bacterium]|nr:ABC transporter permease [Terriglobia bacterium]